MDTMGLITDLEEENKMLREHLRLAYNELQKARVPRSMGALTYKRIQCLAVMRDALLELWEEWLRNKHYRVLAILTGCQPGVGANDKCICCGQVWPADAVEKHDFNCLVNRVQRWIDEIKNDGRVYILQE